MTNLASPMNFNRRRCQRVGRALFKGSTAIFLPSSVDDYGWLAEDFSLTVKWPGNNMYEDYQPKAYVRGRSCQRNRPRADVRKSVANSCIGDFINEDTDN